VKTEQDLIDAGRAAAAEGLRLWHLDVRDPSARSLVQGDPEAMRWRTVIDELHKSAGWGGSTPYPGDKVGEQWCGFFAAHCWRAAGLDPKWLASFFASTIRLQAWGQYAPWGTKANPPPAKGAPRRLVARLGRESKPADLPFTPREGDIVVVGDGSPAAGDHITIATGVDLARGIIHTVEGNGSGNGPDGKSRHGIVVAERPIGGPGYCVRWIYRPAPSDLAEVI